MDKKIPDNQPDESIKYSVMNNLFNQDQPSFYTERRIIGQNDETYLVADLHDDPSPILDILKTLEDKEQFDQKTGKVFDHAHLCFKGDFVDKGVNGASCLLLAYSLKILNPDNVIIMRGNHEDPDFLTICDEKKPESLNFGHEIYCKYYASSSYASCFLSFLFPANKLKKKISKSYAVMPVTALILHPEPQSLSSSSSEEDSSVENSQSTDNEIDPQQYCGFVASHAGLDPALHPEKLLTQELGNEGDESAAKVLFDQYDTENKLHPNNKECGEALNDEIKEQLDSYLSDNRNIICSDASKYCNDKIKSLKEALEKAQSINDENVQEILESEIQTIQKIQWEISNQTFFNAEVFEYLIQEQSGIKTSGYSSVTRDGLLQDVFNKKQYSFEPLQKPKFLKNYEEFFKNNIRSLRDVAACWHWKVPDTNNPSFFKANAAGNIEFNMSYEVFAALFNDWSNINKNIRFALASQGHIQAAHLAYNQFKDNQDAIIKGYGYGDSWKTPQTIITEQNKRVKFQSPANPVIAASCGSIYGCSPTKEEFQKECDDQLKKCKTDQEKAIHFVNYKNKYPGQSYNSIVCLSYKKDYSTIIAQQYNILH